MSMIGHYLTVPQSRLDALREEPDEIEEFLFGPSAGDAVDIDKAWHGLHFLLTGSVASSAAPLGNVVFGQAPIGDDLGYGPAMATDADAVQEIASALAAVTDDQLRARFDPAAMDEIYPNIWDEGDEALDFLLDRLQVLRTFYRDASASGHAVITWLG